MKGHLQPATSSPEQSQGDRHGADVITQAGICQRLGISDETWRRWRARGITPPRVELPGRPRWRVVDVEAFIAGRRWRNTHLSLTHARTVATSTDAGKSKAVAPTAVEPKAVGL